MLTRQIADAVVRTLYQGLDDKTLADVLEAGMTTHDLASPGVQLVNEAIGRELERRAGGARA